MKKTEKIILIVIISVLFLICVFFVPKTTLFRLKADVSSSSDKIHFIKDYDRNGGDAIVIESNGHFGLIDSMNPGPSSSIDSTYNFDVDNGTKVRNYLTSIGCSKLDFIIMTHNHSDHIGGMPELGDKIGSNTKIFYKPDRLCADDVEETKNWHNNEYYLAAINTFNTYGAKLCNLENMSSSCNVTYDSNDSFEYDTNLKHNYSFNFQNFNIKLYNIHFITYHYENLNSIATLLTHIPSGKKTALLGDQETARGDIDKECTGNNCISNPVGTCNKCTKLGIENQLADIIGNVDLLKANHHSSVTSNSFYMFNKFQPRYYVITSAYDVDGSETYLRLSGAASIYYINKKYNTNSYYTNQADGALVFEFSNDLTPYNYNSSGQRVGTINPAIKKAPNNWYSFNNTTNQNKKYVYIQNNNLKLGWHYDGTDNYYLNTEDGIMLTGLHKLTYKNKEDYYYFASNGKMQTGLITINNNVYYFRPNQEEIDGVTYYKGSAVTGWYEINNNWYYFGNDGKALTGINKLTYNNKSGYYYFSTDDNSKGIMQTGWKKVEEKRYYFRKERDDISTGYKGSAVTGWGEIKETSDDNYYKYYFMKSDNEVTEGPAASMVKGLITIDDNTYYFRNRKDEVTIGPEGSLVLNACLVIDNEQYCFDETGKLIEDVIDISKLTIKDGVVIVKKSSTKDTITDLLETTKNISVYDEFGNEINSHIILKTNYTLKIKNDTYPIAILGDVYADGIINVQDVGRAYITTATSNYSELTTAEMYALDYNFDGYYNLLDVNQIYLEIKP